MESALYRLKDPVPPFIVRVEKAYKAGKKSDLSVKPPLHLKVTEVSADKERYLGEYDEDKKGWLPRSCVAFVSEWVQGTHTLYMHHFNSPTWCLVCGQFIWGLGKQAMRCSLCKMPVHKKCLRGVRHDCHEGKQEVADGVIARKKTFSKEERGKMPPSLKKKNSGADIVSRRRSTTGPPGSPVPDSADKGSGGEHAVTELLRMRELVGWLERAIEARQWKNALMFRDGMRDLLASQQTPSPYGVYNPLTELIDGAFKLYNRTAAQHLEEANVVSTSSPAHPSSSKERERASDSSSSSDSSSAYSDDEESGFDGYNTFSSMKGRAFMESI
ncbi:MAG: C1 domain-containing protein [archaeon]|nr:C1 domain-containing protein [archaeon]